MNKLTILKTKKYLFTLILILLFNNNYIFCSPCLPKFKANYCYLLNNTSPITVTIKAYSGSAKIVSIPSTILHNNGETYTVTSIGCNAFKNSKITNVIIPETITKIEATAFKNCKYLSLIHIPDNVTIIGNSAFENCTKLTTVRFGKNSKLKIIEDRAFANCSSLQDISLTHANIGFFAFIGCENRHFTTKFWPNI